MYTVLHVPDVVPLVIKSIISWFHLLSRSVGSDSIASALRKTEHPRDSPSDSISLVMGANCCKGNDSEAGKRTDDGRIKTVVLLVMENRSYDNVLGFLDRVHPQLKSGLTGNEFNLLDPANPDSEKVFVSDTHPYITEADPPHGFGSIRRQVYGTDSTAGPPLMNGFAMEAETAKKGLAAQAMSAFKPEALPITTKLALEFATFDRWFSSMPASTQANRAYIHSATSHGRISNVTLDLIKGFPQKTIYESVEEAGKTFAIYYQHIPSTLFLSNLRNPKYIDNFISYDLFFKRNAEAGTLPNYCIIEQRYFSAPLFPANDNHPGHSILPGEVLIKEIYESLRKSPQWNETLFIITYDEHGGLYDHVPPPSTGIPNPDGLTGPAPDFFNFDRLGLRVPTIMISPWIEKGTVVHEPEGPQDTSQFEHSSIAATLKKIFNLKSFLTKRDEWAGTFEGVFSSRTQPRTDCPETLPEVPTLSTRALPSGDVAAKDEVSSKSCALHEWQEELVLLAYALKGQFGPDVPHTCAEVGKLMDPNQACTFVGEAVAEFLQKKAAA